jgi:hypothetical protein
VEAQPLWEVLGGSGGSSAHLALWTLWGSAQALVQVGRGEESIGSQAHSQEAPDQGGAEMPCRSRTTRSEGARAYVCDCVASTMTLKSTQLEALAPPQGDLLCWPHLQHSSSTKGLWA